MLLTWNKKTFSPNFSSFSICKKVLYNQHMNTHTCSLLNTVFKYIHIYIKATYIHTHIQISIYIRMHTYIHTNMKRNKKIHNTTRIFIPHSISLYVHKKLSFFVIISGKILRYFYVLFCVISFKIFHIYSDYLQLLLLVNFWFYELLKHFSSFLKGHQK